MKLTWLQLRDITQKWTLPHRVHLRRVRGPLVLSIIALSTLAPGHAISARVVLDENAGPLGIYRLTDGRTLWLGPMVDESGPTLQYARSDGAEGRANLISRDVFQAPGDCAVDLRISDNGRRAEWRDCKSTLLAKRQQQISVQSASFTASDGKHIGASFWSAPGAHRPAIVLAHGADDETRQMGTIIPILVDAGLNVLAFDQRGSGESGGDWRSDGVLQIGMDAAQGARELVEQGLAARVGFFGFSNGGWVASAAAARFGEPAFVILKSADSESVAENVIFETATDVRAKFGDAAAGRAAKTMRALLDALAGDTPSLWANAKDQLETVRDAGWLSATQLPPAQALPLAPEQKAAYQRQLIYDPTKDLSTLRCPILILLGKQDQEVDTAASAAGFKQDFHRTRNQQVTILMFPEAGHQLVLVPKSGVRGSGGTYAPGFPAGMISWISRHAIAQR